MVSEIITNESKRVLTLGWDGDAPGMSGAIWVSSWRDKVYFVESSDCEEHGPFSSLNEALDCELLEVETANPELSSEALSLKALKDVALSLVAEGGVVWINGKGFQKRKDVLVRLKERQ